MATRKEMRREMKKRANKELIRSLKRTAGFITSYFTDGLLGMVQDPRSHQGRSWDTCLPLLKAVTLGLASGAHGLGDVEKMTTGMFTSMRKRLGIPDIVPDTTLRDFLVQLDPEELSRLIYVAGYDAWRRKAYRRLEGFKFFAAGQDGKYPTVRDVGQSKSKNYEKSDYLQVHHDKDGNPQHGEVRVVDAVLVNAVGRPLLGSTPVPGDTNELGSFKDAFDRFLEVYGSLADLFMYDAGAASQENADHVIDRGKHYFFQIKNPQWQMYKTVAQLIDEEEPAVKATEKISEKESIDRELTAVALSPAKKNLLVWKHARTAFRVRSWHHKEGEETTEKTRYFVCSMSVDAISDTSWEAHWLKLIVLRWGSETVNQIIDMPSAFQEDDRSWITSDARGTLAVMLLRRLTYAMMTLHKHVHIRNEDGRLAPWGDLFKLIRRVLELQDPSFIRPSSPRKFKLSPAFAQ